MSNTDLKDILIVQRHTTGQQEKPLEKALQFKKCENWKLFLNITFSMKRIDMKPACPHRVSRLALL